MSAKKVILLTLGGAITLFTVLLGGKAILENPGKVKAEKAIAEQVVFLDKPTVLPENEGKVVAFYSTIGCSKAPYDETYDVTFSEPLVRRVLYQYEWSEERNSSVKSEDTYYEAEWRRKTPTLLESSIHAGEFSLDPYYNERLSYSLSYYWVRVPKSELMETKLKDMFHFDYGGMHMFATSKVPTYDVSHQYYRGSKENSFMYECFQESKEVSFIGIQQGNTLIQSGLEQSVYDKPIT
ncbi:MAG: hypothetical protein Q4B26_20190, partial [Eubacteriales bacterium]|nr:hypothetical protein [Eubacteriales bacterium]